MTSPRRGLAAIGATFALGAATLALMPGTAGAGPQKIPPPYDDIVATGLFVHPAGSSHFTFVSSGTGDHSCLLTSGGDPAVRCTVIGSGVFTPTGISKFRVFSADGRITFGVDFYGCGSGTETETGLAGNPVGVDLGTDGPIHRTSTVQTITLRIHVYDTGASGQGC